MLGHAPQLASQSSFWKDTVDQLLADNCVGGSLPLGCAVHGSEQAITDVGDFKKYAPNGELFFCVQRLQLTKQEDVL